ncbi:1,6-anhydro-N-acetylmuramyl-L-alanine amidase [Sphingobium phage Lacusarx]|uniref:N-acetylmuramoyl-L-alanine amidase n=1 Tax=Sphingobium phage Lacusarx TaxID=1980139 RepID=A0A1W6DX33_9CAUD|nr:amidase [Sphingobium phage Lacusarx]ARK07426.1 1,6-anhydro-N-acetylmuramyl-L-alanine amidase [Sphingobium phage Lacusarx]
MNISNHRLAGVDFVASPNISGMLNPQYIVMHYTAGWNDESAITTLKNPAAKVSAHVVIARDGKVTQMVPFNRVAWHAGPSKFDGKNGMNNYSIGIELVNIGFLREKPGAPGVYQLSTGSAWKDVPASNLAGYDLSLKAANKRIGGGTYVWPAYTKAQIDAAKEVVKALVGAYTIKDITTHEIIDTRGWKTDPGPAFPMGEFKPLIHIGNARNDNLEPNGTYVVTASALNVRKEANTGAGVLTVLRKGAEVAVVKDLGDWSYVEYAPGKFGYLTDKYLAAA